VHAMDAKVLLVMVYLADGRRLTTSIINVCFSRNASLLLSSKSAEKSPNICISSVVVDTSKTVYINTI